MKEYECLTCKLKHQKCRMVLSNVCLYCWTFNEEYKKL